MPCPHAAAPGGRTLWGEPGPGVTPGQETLPLRGLRGSGCEAPRVKARRPSAGVIVNTHMCVLRPACQTGTLLRGKRPSWNDDAQHRGTWDGGCPRQAGTTVMPVIGCAGAKERHGER